ncbi:MAG: alanine racemase [Chloroflexia bacterium]
MLTLDIDLAAIAGNAAAVKGVVGPNCELMAVVKANGYGLGASRVARAALEGGATRLAVARVEEGLLLRREGLTCPILVMGYVEPGEGTAAAQAGLTLVVHRERTAEELEKAAATLGLPLGHLSVHVKVDTGMGRFGCSVAEFMEVAAYVSRCPHLRLEGLMTHFASADSPDLTFARAQLETFEQVLEQARSSGVDLEIVHAANSAATLALPEARFNMVRVGIALSGHYPATHLREAVRLQPAATLRSNLARVFSVGPGDSVGYGRTWLAERPSIIGIVPGGYGDGYRRVFSNLAAVLVRGRRCPVVGRVSMDQSTIDLTHVPEAQEGDEAVLFGRQGDAEIAVDELADWAGTISYEILTGITARVPRRYGDVKRTRKTDA